MARGPIDVVTDPAAQLLEKLTRWLKLRVWLDERLRPSGWQVTSFWAALCGFLGALAALAFQLLTEEVHTLLTGSQDGIVESMRLLPWWAVLLVPTLGGALAGAVLWSGHRFFRVEAATDYMEAIVIGRGAIPLRASLIKSAAALFTIGSGGSIGREGPIVQLAAVMASLLGRWRELSPQSRTLLIACGASAGIASAYHAPIAGSFFVAEIILGTIAMESLGPLVVSAVVAALTVRTLTQSAQLYQVPAFELATPWEMIPYFALGILAGTLAPWFLRSLQKSEALFRATRLPTAVRLALGGLVVGSLAVTVPEVCGNGYSVVIEILRGEIVWSLVAVIFVFKWVATAASVGSGSPGGVFTPSLFMGAGVGYLFGSLVHDVWPAGAHDPRAFALVGMGAFLSAVVRAPVMAVILLFEMTLSYDIIMPLMLASVAGYFTARGIDERSIYSDVLSRKKADEPEAPSFAGGAVVELMKPKPPTVMQAAGFEEIARLFLSLRVNNLYVVDEEGRFKGGIALHDIKPFLGDTEHARVVIADDIVQQDFPRIAPTLPLKDALSAFIGWHDERLPVVDEESGRLLGSLAKTDLLIVLGNWNLKAGARRGE